MLIPTANSHIHTSSTNKCAISLHSELIDVYTFDAGRSNQMKIHLILFTKRTAVNREKETPFLRTEMINEQNKGQITQLFCEQPGEAIKMKISHNPVTFCTVNYFPSPLLQFPDVRDFL